MREWKALAWGGMISEAGWLFLVRRSPAEVLCSAAQTCCVGGSFEVTVKTWCRTKNGHLFSPSEGCKKRAIVNGHHQTDTAVPD
jgi:hypothetical protein